MPAGPCKFDRSATFSAEQRVITHRGGIRKMAKTRGTGLLMVWTDVDPEHEAEFNRWYNEEHLNRLLGVPGFLSAGRYRAIRGGPKYLAWYNTVYVPGYVTVPGCIRARRYVCIEGQPKYLTLYEFENPKVPETDAWRTVSNSNPWTHRVRPNLQHGAGSPGVYARIYPDPVG